MQLLKWPNLRRMCRVALSPIPLPGDEAKDLPEDYRKHLGEIADFDRTGSCFVSHYQAELDSAPVARLKEKDVPVFCWTIRSSEAEATARKIADNVTFEGYLA